MSESVKNKHTLKNSVASGKVIIFVGLMSESVKNKYTLKNSVAGSKSLFRVYLFFTYIRIKYKKIVPFGRVRCKEMIEKK
jgi:hypothetical protein